MVDGNRRPFIRLELEDLTLIKNRSHEGDSHCVTHLTTFSSYSIKNDFLNKLLKVCINDIRDIGKEIQSNSQIIALELVSQPASSFMSPPSGSKHAKVRIPYMISSVIQCPRLYIEANTSKESVVL
ncbi:hypothetical protein Tco_1089380 [Tanacetum coccineum]